MTKMQANRIQNRGALLSHGNVAGRKTVLAILEAGLQAADPYHNVLKLMRIENDRLIVECEHFEPLGAPVTGDQVYELAEIERIFVLGAGKGVARVARAIEDVRQTTYLMEVELGAPTKDLNPIRNHLDMLKGGRVSSHLQPARVVHIVAFDVGNYDALMHENVWMHTLPERSTFSDAVAMLRRWDAWDAAPLAVRRRIGRRHLCRSAQTQRDASALSAWGWHCRLAQHQYE